MHRPNRERGERALAIKRRIADSVPAGELMDFDKSLMMDCADNIFHRARRGITNRLEPVIVPKHLLVARGDYQK
ncbi:MAG: hypothetical protein AAB573_05255 [Patescibacteria group bacterium]